MPVSVNSKVLYALVPMLFCLGLIVVVAHHAVPFWLIVLSVCVAAYAAVTVVQIRRRIRTSVERLYAVSNALRDGRWTAKESVRLPGELAGIAELLSDSGALLGEKMAVLSGESVRVSLSAYEAHAIAVKLADSADEIKQRTVSVMSASEEMSSTSSEIAENCNLAARESSKATEVAREGANVVDGSVRLMDEITSSVKDVAKTIQRLSEHSHKVNAIVGAIGEIASQTNLLALNAAIEASRAGEEGRGFAVVAGEVRSLAARTADATEEVSSILAAIQTETSRAVEEMDTSVQKAESCAVEAAHSSDALQKIIHHAVAVNDQISQVAAAATEQSAAIAEIAENIHSISGAVQCTDKESRELLELSGGLNSLAEGLSNGFSQFEITEGPELALLKAKSAHLIFNGKVRAHVDGFARLDPEKMPVPTGCAFGKWYYGEGSRVCGAISEFRQIDGPHSKVHELGKKAVSLANSGDKAGAERTLNEMNDQAEDLLRLIDQLELQCKRA